MSSLVLRFSWNNSTEQWEAKPKRYKKLYSYKSLIDNTMLAATILRIGIKNNTQKTSSKFFNRNMAEPEKE